MWTEKNKKRMVMHGCLHTRSNLVRLYLPKKEGRKGLTVIEDSFMKEIKPLHTYLKYSDERTL